jgi:hypothetical protein
VSIDFDPITVRPRRRRFDPVLVVITAIVAGLAIAIFKPWASSPTPEAPVPPVAVVRAPSVSPTEPPTPTPATAVVAPAFASGLPAATWAEVAPVLKAHGQWGVRAILVVRRPSVGSPASPRFLERWTATTPTSSTLGTAEVARDDRSVVGLGVTFPPKIEPLDMRIWRLHTDDQAEWIDARPLQPADRDGSFTFVRSDPSGSARSWEAGHYRVDLLAADQLYSIAVQIPGRFGSVPTPDAWPLPTESALVPPEASDPSDVQAGLFATVDGGGVPLAAQPMALMSEEVAWRTATAGARPIGRPVVATAYIPRATGLGVMLTNHASIQLAGVRRIAPDARFQAGPMLGGISNTQGGTPWVAFGPQDGGALPPGVYAVTVHWRDAAGSHDETWHVELRPGLLGSGVKRDAGGRPLG